MGAITHRKRCRGRKFGDRFNTVTEDDIAKTLSGLADEKLPASETSCQALEDICRAHCSAKRFLRAAFE